MKIGKREVGPGHPCYIIAEAGTGHAHEIYEHRTAQACRLVEVAWKARADAVKFQMFVPDEPLFCPLPGDEKRWKRWDRSMLTLPCWKIVVEECRDLGIDFLASAFQPTAVQWLKELGVPAYKVASRAALSYPYDSVPGPFLVSSGMFRVPLSRPDRIALQCISKYPTPLAEARWQPWEIDGVIRNGLSDHSGTPWPALDAMARGCPLVEVHFAIDKADAGNDAPVCLTPDQLKLLCEARDGFAALRSH